MRSWSSTGKTAAPAVAVALAALLLAPEAARSQGSGPFTGLEGSWSGRGSVTLSSGEQEPLRCRATYDVENAGNAVKMRLRCASDSYRFDLNGTVVNNSGSLGGTWNEETRKVSGSVSGRATPDRVDARIAGPTFQASITVATRGRRTQAVTISAEGQKFSRVAITMSRAGG